MDDITKYQRNILQQAVGDPNGMVQIWSVPAKTLEALRARGYIERRAVHDLDMRVQEFRRHLDDSRTALDRGDWKAANSAARAASYWLNITETWYITLAGREAANR